MKKNLSLLFVSFLTLNSVFAEKEILPVQTEQVFTEKGDSVFLAITFKVAEDWIVYDSIIGEGGPIPLTFDFSPNNITLVKITKPAHLHKKHDEIFEVDMLYFEENVSYQFVFVKTDKAMSYDISGSFEYMCCNLTSGVCLAPRVVDVVQPE